MWKVLRWTALSIVAIVAIAAIVLFFLDEPLRAYIERQLNANVEGYGFRVGKAHLYPNLTLEIHNGVMYQAEHPDPPVAELPRWRLSVQWRNLLRGRVVADTLMEKPKLHITHKQVAAEAEEEVPLKEKGWQEAVYSFYPIKINEFKLTDGDLTYVEEHDPSRPMRLRNVQLTARNIRNVRSKQRVYPSDLHLEGDVFEGKIRIDGHADFLAEPHFGFKAEMALEHVPLERFVPVSGRYNVQIKKGILSAEGMVEYESNDNTTALLKTMTLDGVRLDYVHAAQTKGTEQVRAKKTVEKAGEVKNDPQMLLKVERGVIKNSEFGFVNKVATPEYRVFLADTTVDLQNFSNHLKEGTAVVKLTGKFMGTGETLASGTFRPEVKSPDFNLNIKVDKTQLKAMNNLLRAYGDVDVTAGLFSVFSELTVKNNAVHGYVKPIFKDVKVYDKNQDRNKGFFHKMYEKVVSGVAKLLENKQRDEVATKTEIAGDLENPKTSTWQAVANLIQNAFFQAILPGFDRQFRTASR